MPDRPKRARTSEDQHLPHRYFRGRGVVNRPLRVGRSVELVAALTLSLSTPALAADSVKIDLVIAAPMPDAQREATMKAVRAFYDFWNAGDEALLQEAIASNFIDHTLPPGRPQGPEGPAFASRRFRAAVRLRHGTHELHRPLHRQVRPNAGQGPAGPLYRDRPHQDRERTHHRQLAHRGQSDAAARDGRRQGRLAAGKQEIARCCLREGTKS
jgi:hypothetical protein